MIRAGLTCKKTVKSCNLTMRNLLRTNLYYPFPKGICRLITCGFFLWITTATSSPVNICGLVSTRKHQTLPTLNLLLSSKLFNWRGVWRCQLRFIIAGPSLKGVALGGEGSDVICENILIIIKKRKITTILQSELNLNYLLMPTTLTLSNMH